MTNEEVQKLISSLPPKALLVETHISFVLLIDEFVYKIKKPVCYSFLDFTSLSQRQFYCQRELELNRRLAPAMYLEVVAVIQDPSGRIRFGNKDADSGHVLDSAVKMVRMDLEREMDKMLGAGSIDEDYIRKLAGRVAAFHEEAVIVRELAHSDAEGYRSDFNDILNHADIFERLLGTKSSEALNRIVSISDKYLKTHSQLISDRLANGFVRDVHGDLHSRNIFAYPEPVIFDCIEFNDHFRQIDVLNEIAFFCMDLEAQGFDRFSKVFLEAYLEGFAAMPDAADSLLFTWFKCYRANIRAKVNALRAAQTTELEPIRIELGRYLRLMVQYAGGLETGMQE